MAKAKFIKEKSIEEVLKTVSDIFLTDAVGNIIEMDAQKLIDEIDSIIDELCIVLSNDDLGRSFFKILLNGFKGIKLIDFENENNNTYNVVTELTYQNGKDEFRPDVIMLINGMPLIQINQQ